MKFPKYVSFKAKFKTIALVAMTTLLLVACDEKPIDPPQEAPSDTVELTFKFNSFLTAPFISTAGDTITVSKLKFLMSGFILEKTTGEFVTVPDAYGFLSLTEKIDSFTIKNVPKGDYKSVRFFVGIDSVVNHANPQQ
jgi:hypothetical protein